MSSRFEALHRGLTCPRGGWLRPIALSFLSLLQGCAIWGPDYEKPAVETPGAFRTRDSYARMGQGSLPEMAWWQKMKDPILDDLVHRALVQNNTVQAAIGGVFKARAILQQIQMRWIPRVDGGVGYISTPNEINPTTVTSIPFSGYTAGFIPNYEINILQQLRTQEQAEASVEVAVAAKNAVRLAIISQVVGSYFGLRLEQLRLERQKDLAEALGEILEKYTVAHKEGLISQFMLRDYALRYANAKAEVPVIEYNIVRFSNTLHALLNENPGTIPASKWAFFDIPYKEVISANVPATVLRNRPDVIAAEQTLRQANANIGVQTTFFFPTFNLTGAVGQSSGSASNLFTNPTSYWQYQGGFQVPIVNLGQFGAIKSAKAQYYADYYNYLQTIRNAFASVDSDLSSHLKYTESLDQMLDYYENTRIRYENEQQRHREGLVSYPDVLTLRATLDERMIEAAQTKYNQLMSIVRLYQDLGGGWKVNDNEEAHDLGDGHRFGDLF